MEKLLLNPTILENKEKYETLSENLDEEVMNFKPYVIKDVLLLSPGVWNGKNFSRESIINGFYKTDWSDKSNYALIYSHDERAENWVGNAINRRVTEEGKLYGDLEIYDKNLAIKLGKGKAKLGISAKVFGESVKDNFLIDRFNNFSIVYDPACKEAFINLSESEIITSDTSKGSEVKKDGVNKKTKYGEKDKIDTNKKEENKMSEEKVNEVEEKVEEAPETKSEEEEPTKESTEELNSKVTEILDKLVLLSEKVEKLEEDISNKESEEEPSKEEEEVSEEPSEKEGEEEVSENSEEEKSDEKDDEIKELSKKLEEMDKKFEELSAKDNEPSSKTTFELSREDLGIGGQNLSDFEVKLLNTLHNVK